MPPPSSPALPLNVTPSVTPSRSAASPIAAKGGSVPPPSGAKIATTTSDISSPHELTAFVESLLEQLDSKFDDMSGQILERMNDMTARVDALEASIQDIINGDNLNAPPSLPQSPIMSRKSGA